MDPNKSIARKKYSTDIQYHSSAGAKRHIYVGQMVLEGRCISHDA